MSDDKDNRGARDRATVSGEEDYEVAYLMKTHGITRERALRLIHDHDGNRERIAQALSAG